MRIPVAGGARLLEELDTRRVRAADERRGFRRGVALIRVDPDRRASRDHGLDHRERAKVVLDVEADLDLDGTIPVCQQAVERIAQFRFVVALQQAEDRHA